MERESFGSKLGILAAAAGSAIGLGNIWKFPFIVGQNGGAAFILVYLVCIALIGLPVMLSEFSLGRHAMGNAVQSFRAVKKTGFWHLGGYMAVMTAFIILSYYAMIAGWVGSYLFRAASGALMQIPSGSQDSFFNGLISSPVENVAACFVVLALTTVVCLFGVKSGIEKVSKTLMPVLLLLLVYLMFKSVSLEGASKGLEFLFSPDFSYLKDPSVILEALGHAFYSLSLGMGIIITYGSYIGKNENLGALSIQVTIADTLIALMAGVVIFPAVFAFGFEPTEGPGLIFITLPAVFEQMPMGGVFATLFFALIGIAALTSTISLMEVVVTFCSEQFNWVRKKATVIVGAALFALSIPSTLSFSVWSDVKIFGLGFFDLFDKTASNILLPLGGLIVCVFVGWVWGTDNVAKEVSNEGKLSFAWRGFYAFSIKLLAPLAILVIFVTKLKELFA
ncbi:MAG: sodium-dependent transporter [Tissierellales bacterium]|jgi:NSS family neurotransmitter:Na+ symporter|nr:sodium-dependent transporter [Tissierellales bacterium]